MIELTAISLAGDSFIIKNESSELFLYESALPQSPALLTEVQSDRVIYERSFVRESRFFESTKDLEEYTNSQLVKSKVSIDSMPLSRRLAEAIIGKLEVAMSSGSNSTPGVKSLIQRLLSLPSIPVGSEIHSRLKALLESEDSLNSSETP